MRINVTFSPTNQRIPLKFNSTSQRIPVRFKDLQEITGQAPDVEIYDGSYEVTPMVDAQIIPTAQKFLTADMTVKEIPFFNVGNTAGGSTVYIGKELE